MSAGESKRKSSQIPEESSTARTCVLAAMLIAIIALAITASLYITAVIGVAGVCAGHYISWEGRNRPRTVLGQLVVGLALIAAIGYLLADLLTAAFGGDLPQAQFAVYAAAITAFDLKSRRNLYSHIWHSLVILYAAGIFAWSGIFLLAVIPWGIAVLMFYAATRSRLVPGKKQIRMRGVMPLIGIWLLTSVVAFIAVPELPGRPLAVPVLVSLPQLHPQGEGLPAAVPLVGTANSNASGSIDLRARGPLGDEVVFHVRAPAGGYWRAYSLDIYTGQSWQRGPAAENPVNGLGGRVQPDNESTDRSLPQVSQTFFVQGNLPSELPGIYPISETYFPAPHLHYLDDGTVEAPSPLTNGVSYGVVSTVRDTSPNALDNAGPVDPTQVDPGYLELSPTVTPRIGQLADQITASASTEYDKVIALRDYLRSHYSYNLNSPRLQPGNDAVDQFLFQDHVGFCEQFASALAVMLRIEQIPSRVAIGWASSDHDALTGTYTVRNRDAHAWVEVLFPGVGWVPFDATPGADPTQSSTGSGNFLNLQALVALGGVPGGAPVIAGGLVVALFVFMMLSWLASWRRARKLHTVLRRYATAQRRLRRHNFPVREPAETVAEHLVRLRAADAEVAENLEPLATEVEELLYSKV